jgi:hypothetical protein
MPQIHAFDVVCKEDILAVKGGNTDVLEYYGCSTYKNEPLEPPLITSTSYKKPFDITIDTIALQLLSKPPRHSTSLRSRQVMIRSR